MITASLVLLDTTKLEDQVYTYETLKFRWSKDNLIHIKYKNPKSIPTFEEHLAYINSGKYKAIYKIMLGNFPVGQIHLDSSNFTGTIIMPSLLRIALKYFKTQNIDINPLDLTPKIFYDLYEKHKDVEVFYASVNPTNTLSMNALLKYGYEPIEIIYAMKNVNTILPDAGYGLDTCNRHKQK